MNKPLERLRHHVSGAIARGEAEPIVGQPKPKRRPQNSQQRRESARFKLAIDALKAIANIAPADNPYRLARGALDRLLPHWAEEVGGPRLVANPPQALIDALRAWVEAQSAQNSAELYRQALAYFGTAPIVPDA